MIVRACYTAIADNCCGSTASFCRSGHTFICRVRLRRWTSALNHHGGVFDWVVAAVVVAGDGINAITLIPIQEFLPAHSTRRRCLCVTFRPISENKEQAATARTFTLAVR